MISFAQLQSEAGFRESFARAWSPGNQDDLDVLQACFAWSMTNVQDPVSERGEDTAHLEFINRAFFTLVREHLTLMLSVVTLISITARVIWVSHGDPVTSTAIISYQGVGGLIATVFAVGLPIMAGLATIWTATDLGEAIREEQPWKGQTFILVMFAAIALVSIPAGWMKAVAIFAGCQVLYAMLTRGTRYLCERRGRKTPWLFRRTESYGQRSLGLLLVITLGAIFPVLVFSDSMWLPKEKVSYENMEEVGYVISGDGDFTHLVLDQNRSSVIIKTDKITDRKYCSQASADRPILTELIWPATTRYEC